MTSDPTFSSPAGLPVGRTTVTLAVVDDSGNVSSSTAAQVIVRDDIAPTAVIDAPSSVAVGDAITVSGSRSTDVGGQVKAFQWIVDGGAPRNQAEPALNAGVLGAGRHTITLKVTDDAGNESAVTSVNVFVGDDIAPTAVLDVPQTVTVGGSIPLSGARSTDVRGRIIRYTWTIDGGSPIQTAAPSFTAAALPLGRHTASLVVTDDSGNESAPVAAAVIVIDDIRPTAVLDAPATATAGAAIALSGARSSDVGGRIVRWRWTVDARPPVKTTAPSFSAPGLSAGTHTVRLVVTDDSGNESAADTRTIVVPTPTTPTAPAGTKLTTFGKVTLIAPQGKKTALLDLRKGTLTLGRLFSTAGGTFKATLTPGSSSSDRHGQAPRRRRRVARREAARRRAQGAQGQEEGQGHREGRRRDPHAERRCHLAGYRRAVALDEDIQAIGRELHGAFPAPARHPVKALDGKAMELASSDDELRAALFRFVDVVPACRSLDDLARHLSHYLERVEDRPPPLEMAMKMSNSRAGRAALGAAAAAGVRHMAHRFIIGASPEEALDHLKARWKRGIGSTLDLLGEATVTEPEANTYAQRAHKALDVVATR